MEEQEKFATVILSTGRWCLRIHDTVVAMEGDLIRTSMIPDRRWERANLVDLCAKINAEHERRCTEAYNGSRKDVNIE